MVLLRTMIDRIDPCAAGKPTAIRTSRTRPTITVRIVAKAIVCGGGVAASRALVRPRDLPRLLPRLPRESSARRRGA